MTDKRLTLPWSFLPNGLLIALIVGLILGWLRYWAGFFIIAQGACLGLLVPWLAVKYAKGPPPVHPGFGKALGMGLILFLAAQVGLMLGYGLAQPWFDPLGWLGRILDDRTAEFVFGIATNTGFARGVAMGAQGGFWLILNILDGTIMFFFLWIMPWDRGRKAKPAGKAAEAAQ